jgi:hypothetical protein
MSAPSFIGGYRVVATIAEGGMGVVYRALEESSGAVVAIKTVRGPDVSNLSSLRREIHALSRIVHPSVVRIFAQGVEAGLPWYAMELIEGPTMRDAAEDAYVQTGTGPRVTATQPRHVLATQTRPPTARFGIAATAAMPELTSIAPHPHAVARSTSPPPSPRIGPQVWRGLALVRQLCGALAHLHGEGIVHRDLKPDNVIVRADETPVLVDFGLVGHFDLLRELLDPTGMLGTIEYMAPEQIRGELVDARADLYALGCILFEVVVGRPPFCGNPMEVAVHHLQTPPVAPGSLIDGVPPALDALVLQLLAKAPRDRIGFAEDVARKLGEIGVQGAPRSGAARPRTYLYRPQFSGRSAVLASLAERLDEAGYGRGHLALIAAESGAGKTRLAIELSRVAMRRRVRVIAGGFARAQGSVEQGALVALEAFRPLFEVVATECHVGGAALTEALLGDRAAVLAPYHDAFAHFAPKEPAALARLPAQAARERLIDAIVTTILALAHRGPMLLVVDDLQWADELSLDVLAALATRGDPNATTAPLLIVGAYRVEESSEVLRALGRCPRASTLSLAPLEDRDVATMIADMLALHEAPPSLSALLVRSSEGNPLFVAEYLRAAVDEGLLTRGPDGQWLARGVIEAALPLPREIRELVARRLHGLPAAALALAQVASVIGRDVDAELLARASKLDDTALLFAIEELVARNVLEDPSQLGARGAYRFAQDKLREGAYAGMTVEARSALHLAVGRAMEARAAREDEPRPQDFALFAHHFELGGDRARALSYLERAGEHALTSGAHGTAARFFERALELGAGEPPVRRARWARLAGEATFGVGDLRRSTSHSRDALAHLGARMPDAGASLATFVVQQIGARLIASTRRAPVDGDATRAVEAANAAAQVAHTAYYAGDALGLVGASLLAVNLAERTRAQVAVARPTAFLGYVAGLAHLDGLAKRFFTKARDVGEATQDPSGLAFTSLVEAAWHVGEGRFVPAERSAHVALALLRVINDKQEGAIVETLLGHCEHFTGRYDAASARFEAIHVGARARGNVQHEAWGLYAKARSLLPLAERGDRALLDEAEELLARAARCIEDHPDQASRAICTGLLAEAALARRDLDLAVQHADACLRATGTAVPTVFSTVHAYEAMARVYLEAWASSPAFEEKARRACRQLRLFGRLFALGKPAALACTGLEHARRGNPTRARRALEASERAARDLGMITQPRVSSRPSRFVS